MILFSEFFCSMVFQIVFLLCKLTFKTTKQFFCFFCLNNLEKVWNWIWQIGPLSLGGVGGSQGVFFGWGIKMLKIITSKKLKNHCWAVSIFEDEEEEDSLDFDQGPIKGLTGRHWARKISSDYFLLSAANEPAQVFTQLLFKRSFETAETIWEILYISIKKPFIKYTL